MFTEGFLGEPFTIENGVRQGCCLAPMLFNFYYAQVIKDWQGRVAHPDDQVPFHSRGVLLRCFQCVFFPSSNIETFSLTNIEFADDLAIFSHTQEGLALRLQFLHETFEDWDLQ